jgi:hypothetical protein
VQSQVTAFAPGAANRKLLFRMVGLFSALGCLVALIALLQIPFKLSTVIGAASMGSLVVVIPVLNAVYSLSVRVEIDHSKISYRSIFGRKVIELREVQSAILQVNRGYILTVRTSKRRIRCTESSFSKETLVEMQRLIEKRRRELSVLARTESPKFS